MSGDSEGLRTPETRPDAGLARVFAPEGPLAASVPGYRPRAAQIEMANAVSLAIETQDVLICEAGTGTGKTFAYLVPALLSGRRTIISTGTRNLQEQLFHRDLPLTRNALGVRGRCALLKGRGNYLCSERLKQSASSGPGLEPEMESDLAVIRDWASRTVDGDIAELAEVPENAPAWRHATSTPDNCLRQECPLVRRMPPAPSPAQRDRSRSSGRQTTISSLPTWCCARRASASCCPVSKPWCSTRPTSSPRSPPASSEPPRAVRRWRICCATRSPRTATRRATSRLCPSGCGIAKAPCGRCTVLLRGASAAPGWRGRDAIREPEVERAAVRLVDSLQCFSEALEPMAVRGAALQSCFQRAENALARVRSLTRTEGEGGTVRWVETQRFGFTFHASPLDVAPMISERVYAERCAWVFTSATLAVDATLAHFAQRLGLDEPLARVWPSPFDFKRQALCYLPPGLPDPRSPGYRAAFVEELVAVVEATRGRAFVLFTSYRAMEEVQHVLPARIPYPVLLQGSAPRNALLDRFRRRANAVLLGTYSFWEGVDVRGEALSCVVIDKLPFAPPDDPVLRARMHFLRESGRDPFVSHQLPQAVLLLKQGVGRLLRDPGDRGVVVLCDPRIVRRGYGRVFLNSLPPMPTTRDRDAIRSFFPPEDHGAPRLSDRPAGTGS